MENIKWDEKYRLGFDMIDNQHKEIFKLLNDAFLNFENQKYEEVVGNIVEFLDDYIIYHFSQEEELQEFIEYPDIIEHKKFHKHFLDEFYRFKDSINGNGPPMNAIKSLNMLADWLVNHIQSEDYKLVSYIKKNNL